jgi:CheY-like chemotaxis protein
VARALKFLIVEDDEVVRFLRRRDLERHFADCSIVECDSAETGMAAAAAGTFDALITDYKLPEATGVDLIAELRGRGLTCPMLLVTGNDDPAVHRKAFAAGASHVLSGAKPAFVQALLPLAAEPTP